MQRRLALFLPLLLVACGETAAPPEAAPPPARVGVVEVRPQPTPIAFDYGGRVTAVRQTEVRARVAGILLERSYTEGAAVEAGAVLFRIDPARYQAAVDLAAAEVQQAEAELQRTRRDQQRAAELLRADVGSRKARDDAAAALAAAEAGLAAARARLATARLELGYTTVTAPIAGVTSLEAVPEGSLVSAGGESSLLTRITQLDPVYVAFAFNAPDLAALTAAGPGPLAARLLPGEGEGAEGRVTFTEAVMDPATGTVRGRASFANGAGRLVPGQFVRIRVSGAMRDAIRIPQAAVQQDVQGPFAYVVGPDGRAERRGLRLGRRAGAEWVIEDGLRPGDRVIAEGVVRVTEGAPVQVAEAAR
ncbi:efflux RND transporter periplasmic adaptor subunit [Pseudoroseomonas cervicalis]|uniref:efflux RND transporter periplasmic adaptor subunit n=1 Tax=Teichococcus cervicalis TaxID=204525 RepID=UPI002788505B|nr:efflux RND transporter periplasmic adaptor subunit [Pseudoroseomonas cervicalis]MDQ1080645.1 membrane fusion protein (multidrug efflux system) [Pseudoroseomonas cervicalis]